MLSYAVEPELSPSELGDVFRRSGIRRPADDPERLAEMIRHANLIVTARLDGKLVGVARALTDFSWICFVSDLAVVREHQRSGIGRALMNTVRQYVGDQVAVGLFAAPGAEDYYAHIGLEAVSGWRIPRTG